MIRASAALKRLVEGNRRFAEGLPTERGVAEVRPEDLADGQAPFAVILGCSDSRVPAEIIFGQGLGDLFVIRVAGNVVAPSQIGSVEFAATKFGTRLVVVLGHTRCGAVEATVEQLLEPAETRSRNLHSIVEFVSPSVEALIAEGYGDDTGRLVSAAVRANIHRSVQQMRHGSDILESLERDDGLRIVGAEYCLETGRVEFFDDLP